MAGVNGTLWIGGGIGVLQNPPFFGHLLITAVSIPLVIVLIVRIRRSLAETPSVDTTFVGLIERSRAARVVYGWAVLVGLFSLAGSIVMASGYRVDIYDAATRHPATFVAYSLIRVYQYVVCYPGRRSLLLDVLLLAGVAVIPDAAARSLFAGPRSLPAETMTLLTAVADTLIPVTDTPGAVAAGVPAMFDKLLANWASASHRAGILAALQAIETEAGGGGTTAGFAALSPARRFDVLNAFDKARASDPGYGKLRELLVTLYYLSEIGSTVELRYEHAPGAWEPSIPVTAETRNYGGP
jgi:Gluconate 2-dehydrogenase subunit 3